MSRLNLQKSVNGASGTNEIEGKAAMGSGERAGRQASFKSEDLERQLRHLVEKRRE